MLDHRIAVHVLFEEGQNEDVEESPVHLRLEAADVRFTVGHIDSVRRLMLFIFLSLAFLWHSWCLSHYNV